MTAVPVQKWTPETYLDFDRASEQKYEYLDGEIFLMAGGSPEHNQIQANTLASLLVALRRRPCIVYPSDQRVKISATDYYTYPDITIVCGTPQFTETRRDTLTNPTLIVEVLSPSTERYDRGRKFQHYRTLESLQEYVLISQDSHRIEHYVRRDDEQWLFSGATGLEATIELPSIQCTLLLADVYDKVVLSTEAPEDKP